MNRPRSSAFWLLALAPLPVFSAEALRPPSRQPAISPITTPALRPILPTYTPAPSTTKPSDPIAAAEPAVMMDKVIVQGPKLPTFGELQLLTEEQRASLLKKRYPGAVVPLGDPLTETVPNYAATMLRDDTRQENLRGLQSTAELYRLSGDAEGAKKIKLETQKFLIRRNDWRTEGMDRSYNNGRR
jgi:hypothetical protein